MKTLCLCMIVKNEVKILKECFDSVVNFIDYWVICDTGSTDGTQEFIKNYFKGKGIQGDLYEDKWVNFGHNRTLAFKKAKGKSDYCLVMDADDRLSGTIEIPEGEYCNFKVKIRFGCLEFYRNHIFNNSLNWCYKGVVHEYPYLLDKNNYKKSVLQNCCITAGTFGARSTGQNSKFLQDIKLLKQGIKDEPKNTRYYFYLAQSYRDIGDNLNAIKYYRKRAEMGGFQEEVYYSLYSIGLCKERDGRDFEKEILYDYLKAFNFRKTRLEALYRIVLYFRIKGKYKESFAYGMLGYPHTYPKDILFIDKPIHDYSFMFELAISAYYVGFYKLSYDLNQKIIDQKLYPKSLEKLLFSNIKFSKDKLKI